jgi:hypothetical protein
VNGVPLWKFKVRLNESAGVATKITRFRINGEDYSGSIDGWFGTQRLGENGTLETELRTNRLPGGGELYFEMVGVDEPSGRVWSATVSARFVASPR